MNRKICSPCEHYWIWKRFGTALEVLGNHTAVRANTRDRLPMVGMIPQSEAMSKRYAALAQNAHKQFTETGSYHPNLYVTAGHGSNGLATTPLAGEYIASLITNGALPIDRDIMNALNPTRFQIQDLKKQRKE